jgi:uncharacterized LabA/DUF88 family protein
VEHNYFFIDGSALCAQIRQLRRADSEFSGKRLNITAFIQHVMDYLNELHNGSYKRVTIYFPAGDEASLYEYIVAPDYKSPGLIRDLHIKYCGKKLKYSSEFSEFVETSVPSKFRDRVTKSEKGIDIEMCCDALRLASRSQLERLFILTNDSDFVPLCRTLKEFGANVSILHLSKATKPNMELLTEADSYDVVEEQSLASMFVGPSEETEESTTQVIETAPVEAQGSAEPEKPDAEPSDLIVEVEAEDEPTS